MKLENNNIKISISKQMMEVVENVFTLTVCILTQTADFFFFFFCSTVSQKELHISESIAKLLKYTNSNAGTCTRCVTCFIWFLTNEWSVSVVKMVYR